MSGQTANPSCSPQEEIDGRNDILRFRKIHPTSELSRGRSIIHILHDRAIYGPKRVGGIRASLEKQKAALLLASPSSVIRNDHIDARENANGANEEESTDSLSEVLRDGDSLSEVLGNAAQGRNGNGSHNFGRNDHRNANVNGNGNCNGNENPSDGHANAPEHNGNAFHQDLRPHHFGGYHEDEGFKYNYRLKMNAYPTNVHREIKNFAEQQSITQFDTSYLSLDFIRSPTTRTRGTRPRALRRRHPDDDSNEFATSTISVAFSPDGRTVASTHGDHTVKISCCNTGALIRSLEGHPRTPWTVKYHPTKSNIVASGCLGYEVRIFDWNHPIRDNMRNINNGRGSGAEADDEYNYHKRKGVCLKMIKLRNSIISLSFHPTGSVLAIACGHSLHLWVYEKQERPVDGESCMNGSWRDNNNGSQIENGDAGASDGTNSNAHGHEQRQNSHPSHNFQQQTSSEQTVLHQVRYSHNLRCVHFPPGGDKIIIGGVNPTTDVSDGVAETSSYSLLLLDFNLNVALMSPNDFNYYQSPDPNDHRRTRPSVEVLTNYRTLLHRALLYNDGGFDVSADGKTLCGCAELWLPVGVTSAAELIEKQERERIAVMERSFSDHSAPSDTTTRGESKKERKKRKDIDSAPSLSSPSSRVASSPYSSPPRQGTLPPIDGCLTPPNPSRPDPTSPPSPPGRRWISHDRRLNARNGNGRSSFGNSDRLPPIQSLRRNVTGGRYLPHVVVVSLDDEDGTLGKVLEATPLGSKSASVTCVKFSPSAEFCLLGYGVREQGQNAFGSPYHPVNALYRVRGGMTQVATMLSDNDDVNIARFHPDSGVGFVYGTKQGRVRVLGPRPWNFYYD